jgi:predicted CopG family antitoxin
LHTIRVSDQIYHAITDQMRGNDSFNDVVTRWYLGSQLLRQASTKDLRSVKALQELALAPGGAPCNR